MYSDQEETIRIFEVVINQLQDDESAVKEFASRAAMHLISQECLLKSKFQMDMVYQPTRLLEKVFSELCK